jgi:hypothetical protein
MRPRKLMLRSLMSTVTPLDCVRGKHYPALDRAVAEQLQAAVCSRGAVECGEHLAGGGSESMCPQDG